VTQFDYVMVGAGPAGCVLANRLSADPGVDVPPLEAGGRDTDPLIAMPWGFAELLGDPTAVWHHPTRPFGPSQQVEHWVRGKTLGGSSSVNGIVYNRGNRADYETMGGCGYHAIGTCAMGPNDDDVVDPRLRVRGVTNLRVVDASVLPIMVSGNLNGPVSALAWRAADLVAEGA